MKYDVIIAGGSYGGLAAAIQLRGKRVLMVEPNEIGAVQTSACGTLLSVLEATGTTDSLLQVHEVIVIHFPGRAYEFPLSYPFCTFEHRTLCSRLFAQADVELVRGSVLGHRGNIVSTTQGEFEAEILIDASGWRAALATNAQQQAEPHDGKCFGLETVVPVEKEGLHFYYDKGKWGSFNIGWLFPIGPSSRAGFGSYRGNTRLNARLKDFSLDSFGNSPDGIHGGFWPCRRRPATTGNVFRIGDAAGQCLPLTGEGIRPAMYFGAQAGRLARRVLDGEMLLADALRAYREMDQLHLAKSHSTLLAAQKIVPALPMTWIKPLAGLVQSEKMLNYVMWHYWKTVNPSELGWPKEYAMPISVVPDFSAYQS